MKNLSWEKQREYNLNLEYLYSLKDRQLEISDSEKLEKIEFRLYTDIFEYNGNEYVTYSKEMGVFDTIEEAINKYIELKLSEEIGKKDNSFVRKIAWTSFDGEVFGRVQFTVNMFNASYGEEYITLKEWAEREGISDITARAKARKGLLESAKNMADNGLLKLVKKILTIASKFMEFIRRVEMKEKLTIDNLQFSHYDNGDHELEFMVDGKRVFVKVSGLGSLDDEDYWDIEENVKRAVEEADEDNIWIEE